MPITQTKRRRTKEPQILVPEHKLTILLAKDNGSYCATCPELDLVTQLPTADAALEDLIEAIRDCSKEYLRDRKLYSTSPNRAHHLPYIEAIAAANTDRVLRSRIEVKNDCGHV